MRPLNRLRTNQAAALSTVAAGSAAQDLFERGRQIIAGLPPQPNTKPEPAPAVPRRQARVSSSNLPACTHPVEVDLADPDAERHIGNSGTNVYVCLEELHPADPGQLSGARLRILESGRYTLLNAESTVLLRGGEKGSHWYGCLDGAELAAICQTPGTPFFIRLREFYFETRPAPYSGLSLTHFSGDDPELRACFGTHCLGVLRGGLLLRFLNCLRQRCEMVES